jgi:choline-glycine betaine transporter
VGSNLAIIGIALAAVFLALALAFVPARMLLIAIGRSIGNHVREFVRRRRDRRARARGTPDRRKEWPPPSGSNQS